MRCWGVKVISVCAVLNVPVNADAIWLPTMSWTFCTCTVYV